MKKYLATQRYVSGLYPGGFAAGDILELEDALALAINRDSPGTLVANPDGVQAPPEDRQMHAPPQRRDRGEQSAIDTSTYKAVKDK